MTTKLFTFFVGEIVVGILLVAMSIPSSTLAIYFLLRFLRLAFAVTFNVFMYLYLFSYKNKTINVFLYVYFLISVYFIANIGNVSLFQWLGYKMGIYLFNLL